MPTLKEKKEFFATEGCEKEKRMVVVVPPIIGKVDPVSQSQSSSYNIRNE